MKKVLKFLGILIIANIKKILIIGGILLISSFSYYGAVDENGERVISFEQNETQSAFKSEVIEEQQEIKQEDIQQEEKTAKVEEQKEEIEPIQAKQEEIKEENKTVQKVSKKTEVKEKTPTKEVLKQEQKETKQQEEIIETQQEIKQEETKTEQEKEQEEIKYTEVEVKIAEKTECIDNKHCAVTGNSNKWFKTQAEAIAEYNAELEKWSQKYKSGEITYDELTKKSPYGYETWNCPKCNQYTLNYYYN